MPQTDPIQGFTGLPLYTEPYAVPDNLAALYKFVIARAIPQFASTTARDAALTSPTDGMMAVTGTGTSTILWIRATTWQVAWCQRPVVDVIASALQSIPAATETTMTYSTVIENVGGMWNPAQTDRVTCTVAGLYMVTVTSSFASAPTGSRIIVIRKNGTSIRSFAPNVLGVPTSEVYTFPLRLAVGDYIQFNQYQSSGSPINTNNQSYPRLSAAML